MGPWRYCKENREGEVKERDREQGVRETRPEEETKISWAASCPKVAKAEE